MESSFSWTRVAPSRGPPGGFNHGGPKPEGYRWPPGSMQVGAFLVYEVCGSAGCPDATEKHDEWHAGQGG